MVPRVPFRQIGHDAVVEAFDLALSSEHEVEFGGLRGGRVELLGGGPELRRRGVTLQEVWLLGKCL